MALRIHRGMTVLELLVTMSILTVLAALSLPVVSVAREAARQTTCVNHLRQLGFASHDHHDSQGQLPVGWQFDACGESAYGWAASLLPYVGEAELHERIDMTLPVDAPSNNLAREAKLSLMLCPSDIASPSFMLYAENAYEADKHESQPNAPTFSSVEARRPLLRVPTTNYVGIFGTSEMDDSIPAPLGDGAFLENRRIRFRDFKRGRSGTLLIGERAMVKVPSTWYGVDLAAEDAAARLVGAAIQGINNPYADECEFSSRHSGGANFLYADGQVEFVTEDIDLVLYHEVAQLRTHGDN